MKHPAEICAVYGTLVVAAATTYVLMFPMRMGAASSGARGAVPSRCPSVGDSKAEMRYSTPSAEYTFIVSLHPSAEDGVVSRGIREGSFGEANRYPSVDEMHSICELAAVDCAPGKVFVEVGSAIGMVSLYMASRGMTVFAFDPLRPNVERLSESRCLNHERAACAGRACGFSPATFHILWGAVGSDDDPPTIEVESEPGNLAATMRGGGSVRAAVERMTIDATVVRGSIEIMLLTCQGFELNALLGASRFLRSGRMRAVVWRVHSTPSDGGARARRIAHLLHSHGYRFFGLEAARAGTGGPAAMTLQETLDYIATVRARGGHPNVMAMV